MDAYICKGPGGSYLVNARDEGHARTLMVEKTGDEKWHSHDHASADRAGEGEPGVIAELPTAAVKAAKKAAAAGE